jgi:diacylglycerol O-acyltransferase
VPTRLTPLDGAFLRVESGTGHMHVAWLAELAPAPGHALPGVDDIRALVADRLPAMPRMRQRLANALPGLGEPFWVDDPDFAVAHHVHSTTPRGGMVSRRRWLEAADALLSTPLPRSRPLWHIALARLPADRLALLCRMHHAMVDGIAALELGLLLLGREPTAPPAHPPEWTPATLPSRARLSALAVEDALMENVRRTLAVTRAGARPRSMLRRVSRSARDLAQATRRDVLWTAPSSRLNAAGGSRRALVQHRLPLATVRLAAAERDATVTEVCISLVAGALRSALAEPPSELKAMIPVSTAAAARGERGGNHLSFGFVSLPLTQPDPEARLADVRAQCRAMKRSRETRSRALLIDLLGLLPPPVRSLAATAAVAPRMANLTLSSIPGPNEPLYLLGAELLSVYPVVPLAERHALAVGVLGYREHLHIGLHVDPDALPEAPAFAQAIVEELRTLRPGRFARRRASSTGRSLKSVR